MIGRKCYQPSTDILIIKKNLVTIPWFFYPDHVNALRKAVFTPPNFPTMGDLWSKQDEKMYIEKEPDVSKKKTECDNTNVESRSLSVVKYVINNIMSTALTGRRKTTTYLHHVRELLYNIDWPSGKLLTYWHFVHIYAFCARVTYIL